MKQMRNVRMIGMIATCQKDSLVNTLASAPSRILLSLNRPAAAHFKIKTAPVHVPAQIFATKEAQKAAVDAGYKD